jgi:hypothetical protein
MASQSASTDNQRQLAEALRAKGVAVGLSVSGWILRCDFRAVAAQVDDRWLTALNDSPKLRELHLAGAKITSACVDDLLSLKRLELLDVQQTPLDDDALDRLAALPCLSLLVARGTLITPSFLQSLRKRLTKVRIVA